jgi:DNA-binding MarR family transcriptional regulator
MEKEKSNHQNKLSKYGYTMISDYFFRELAKVAGSGPGMLYLALLSYCHKKKDIAWPSLNTLSRDLRMAKTTVLRNLNILVKLNFIRNISRNKSDQYHKNNVYQITPPEKISLSIFSLGKNNEFNGSKMKLDLVAKCYPNINNLNNNNITTTNREKDVVVAVDFIKLKEERRKRIKEDLTGLDFKDSFIEKLLKDFPLDKMEEKLELLKEKKNIINPSGWLLAALKNDYQGSQEEETQEVREEKKEEPQRKFSSPEEALRQIRLAKEKLALIIPYYQIKENKEKGGLPIGT